MKILAFLILCLVLQAMDLSYRSTNKAISYVFISICTGLILLYTSSSDKTICYYYYQKCY